MPERNFYLLETIVDLWKRGVKVTSPILVNKLYGRNGVIDILKTSKKFNSYRIDKRKINKGDKFIDSYAYFWSFEKDINKRNIIVVVCQINTERKQFISVVDLK